MRSNYIASMFSCYPTFDNLPDSSEVWNELEKELVFIGKAAWTVPLEQQPVLDDEGYEREGWLAQIGVD